MRYLSLFSGIEAASVAWKPLGWECIGVAEIEKFPSAALAHHYPDVKNFGDITKITEEQIKAIGRIDLIVGGFPCQDLSVAGKRAGLKHDDGTNTRSGLFYDAMRIVRWARTHCGLRWLLVENVPGLFSSSGGNDFACVLGEMVGTRFDPPKNKWQETGMALGPDGLAEWCVLDAQWFGVAQRRKRVFALHDFLVASAGIGCRSGPVLFEPESLLGDSAPSREKGQTIAACLGVSPASSSSPNVGSGQGNIVAGTMTARMGANPMGAPEVDGGYYIPDIAPTMPSRTKAGGGLGTDFDLDGGVIECSYSLQGNMIGRRDEAGPAGARHQRELSYTLTKTDVHGVAATQRGGGDGGVPSSRGEHIVAIPINMQAAAKNGARSPNMVGVGNDGDPSPTINASDKHAVACWPAEITPTLNAAFGEKQGLEDQHALGGAGLFVPSPNPLFVTSGQANAAVADNVALSLNATNEAPYISGMSVRRLTPTECERLQGFPDGYTNIPWRKSPTSPDGPRYKALGNSMAVPCMAWIGRRIARIHSLEDLDA